MQIGFVCPDGFDILHKNCLKKPCRLGERCVSLPTLTKMSSVRKWTGKPSTTQLLNGTRLSMLILYKNFFVSPQSLAFSRLGTDFHASLETFEFIMEKKFEDLKSSGTADYYDPEERILWDFKTSGHFKVMKCIGMIQKKVPDPNGAKYKKAGKGFKAGDPKMVTQWIMDSNQTDSWDWTLQLNKYRLFFESSGYPVNKMKIEVTVRDGGLRTAAMSGIKDNIYIINIQRLPDDLVINYFNKKIAALRTALAISWAPLCHSKENWNYIRCERFCNVAEDCKKLPASSPFMHKFNSLYNLYDNLDI